MAVDAPGLSGGAWRRCRMDPRDKHEDDGFGMARPKAVKTVAPETGLSLLQSRDPRCRRKFAPSAAAFFAEEAAVSTWLPKEIEAKRKALPQVLRHIAEAGGLPNETYTSQGFAAV